MPVVILDVDRVVMVRVVAPVWVPAAVPSAVMMMHVTVIWVVPSAITIVPRVVPSAHVERIIPTIVSVWCVCPRVPIVWTAVPWVKVSAPVPAASDAVWSVI